MIERTTRIDEGSERARTLLVTDLRSARERLSRAQQALCVPGRKVRYGSAQTERDLAVKYLESVMAAVVRWNARPDVRRIEVT